MKPLITFVTVDPEIVEEEQPGCGGSLASQIVHKTSSSLSLSQFSFLLLERQCQTYSCCSVPQMIPGLDEKQAVGLHLCDVAGFSSFRNAWMGWSDSLSLLPLSDSGDGWGTVLRLHDVASASPLLCLFSFFFLLCPYLLLSASSIFPFSSSLLLVLPCTSFSFPQLPFPSHPSPSIVIFSKNPCICDSLALLLLLIPSGSQNKLAKCIGTNSAATNGFFVIEGHGVKFSWGGIGVEV